MTTTIGSLDLGALNDLRDDVTQYFWFESDSTSAWGSGAHVTLYPESQFTNPNNANYLKGQNILMNTDGFSIRNGALPMMILDNDSLDFNIIDTIDNTYTNVASFGAISTIGITDNTQSYLRMDYHSMQMKDKEGNTYFHISDLRDSSGNAEITLTYYGDGETDYFYFTVNAADTTYTVTVSDSSGGTVTKYLGYFKFSSPPTNGATITVVYNVNSYKAKAYSIGLRGNGNVGIMSVAEGYDIVASGYASHAEGNDTKAVGNASHAEGEKTVASGPRSHAEGFYTVASESFSHAQNYHTIAAKRGQTAIGTYNIEDTSTTSTHPSGAWYWGKYAVIIGNGTTDSSRSNALTVDWNGDVRIGGNSHAIGDRPQTGSPTGEVTSLNTGTWKVVGRFTAPKGVSIINVAVGFESNATGRRQAFISSNNTDDSSGLVANTQRDYRNAVNGASTSCHFSYSIKLNADTTYYIKAYQNSGSQLTISSRVYITVIK